MVLRDLDQYVVKPTGASGGYGVVIGPQASDRELAETRERIERDPAAIYRPAGDPTFGSSDDHWAASDGIRGGRAAAHRFPAVCAAGGPSARPAGRAYAGGPARGFANRQFLTGRRQQGHLGAGVLMLRRIADHCSGWRAIRSVPSGARAWPTSITICWWRVRPTISIRGRRCWRLPATASSSHSITIRPVKRRCWISSPSTSATRLRS